MGGTDPLSYGSLWDRLVRGVRWSWVDPRYRAALPPDLDASVMTLESRDRLHAKQGRSTATGRLSSAPEQPIERRGRRVPAIAPLGPVAVYLKRHFRLPWLARVAALVDPAGRHSPGAAEWAHLRTGPGAGRARFPRSSRPASGSGPGPACKATSWWPS